jgi:hypothetical protein
MMATGNDTKDLRPDIGESYAVSIGSSNLRVGDDHTIRTPGDLPAAAGMNKHRTGLALRRLLSEWDKSAKPREPSREQIEALAASYPRIAGSGKVRIVVRENGADVGKELPPIVAARIESARWYANELSLLLLSLRSLPAIRSTLLVHAREQGWGGDVHLVAHVLLWWLDSRCPACQGRRNKIIAGTGRTGSHPCGTCHGTGTKDAPHGWEGTKLLTHIKGCLTAAARDLSEGTFKHQRSDASLRERERQKLIESGAPVQKLPPKIPPRRYSEHGKFFDGEYVTRSGQGDVHRVTEMDEDGFSAAFICVVAPESGWCEVGHRELNLCRRYSRVEYDPKKE